MKTQPRVAIVGAGLVGRTLALSLCDDFQVTLFDRDDRAGSQSAAYIAAAMLAPLAESSDTTPELMRMGEHSVSLWPELLEKLDRPVFFQQNGSLILAYEPDRGHLDDFGRRIKGRAESDFFAVGGMKIAELEPELGSQPTPFQRGLYLPNEGQLDNRQLLASLAVTLQNRGVTWHSETEAEIDGKSVRFDGREATFDWVIDCRGVGAKTQDFGRHRLRGVRGEVVRLHAPDVTLNRAVRLMHPRYPIYIAPKEDHRFVVGATQIESEDQRQPTVRSALELLSACFSVHKGFAEAEILEIQSGLRPAFEDNEPKIRFDRDAQRIQVNGLFRHGYLLTPAVVEQCVALIKGDQEGVPDYPGLVERI